MDSDVARGHEVPQLHAAIDEWAAADELPAARAAAEIATNLVTGPAVSGFGDRDGDSTVGGAVAEGLLPGEHGEAGLASNAGSTCLDADVLGGRWDDPAVRWAELHVAISRWSPAANTFPALRGHPQRIVGWASLALATDDLVAAHE